MRLVAALLLCASFTLCAQEFDLLIRNGRLIDPKNRLDGRFDVAIKNGKIAAVAASIDSSRARKTVNAEGLIVTPGLIDLHVHVFFTAGNPGAWAGDNSVQPDAFSFRTGVTTMVDAGSSGWRNFEIFRTTVIDRARTRVLAMLNVAGFGMISDSTEQEDFDPDAIAKLAAKHKDVIVGVKSAHYQRPDWESVDAAVEAGRKADIPVMVDFGYFLPQRPYYKLVTEHLRPGDISTHMFRGPVPYVNDKGELYPYLIEARKRGVRFDVGHGGGSFVLRNAAGALKNGFYPDTISSDLHTGSMNGAFMDMPALMSKLMALGLPLQEAVRASTWTPAEVIKRTELGHLSVGAVADIALLRVMEGEFGYWDNNTGKVVGKQRLFCEMTLKGGAVTWDWNGRMGVDFRTLGPSYGIRQGVDQIILPGTAK
ncbi:MAG TPA: amidohydrolase/deacetylase family metallohydrolase [Bryobacteraceae bacterium]|nr:amidohydrolase/deacetylase family metallohydrolase [Bryobacteraceae bacterium]